MKLKYTDEKSKEQCVDISFWNYMKFHFFGWLLMNVIVFALFFMIGMYGAIFGV